MQDSKVERFTPQPFVTQLADLVFIELTNWRWSWRSMVVLGVITPLGAIFAISILLGDADERTFGYVLTGNLVLSLMFENQNRTADHIFFMRFYGTLDYFGSLPVRKDAMVLAVLLAFFILSLPSALLVVALGSLILSVKLSVHPLVVIVIPICAIPMSAVGALIGIFSRTSSEALSLGLITTMVMAGLGAVIVPPEMLPQWMPVAGQFSPATYAASALRQTLLGPVTTRLVTDLLVLVGFSAIALYIVSKRIDWRKS